MNDQSHESMIEGMIYQLIAEMRDKKPGDRSEQDRYWAIAITETEKLRALWMTYVLGDARDV